MSGLQDIVRRVGSVVAVAVALVVASCDQPTDVGRLAGQRRAAGSATASPAAATATATPDSTATTPPPSGQSAGQVENSGGGDFGRSPPPTDMPTPPQATMVPETPEASESAPLPTPPQATMAPDPAGQSGDNH